MKLLYLVIAHKNPGQMARMIRRLSGPEVSFLIHVDGQVPLIPFIKAFADAPVQGLHPVFPGADALKLHLIAAKTRHGFPR